MYIFPDKNNGYLNQEVDLRLSQLTSQGLIKSEDEYKLVVQNTLNSINSDLSRITNLSNYTVKLDDPVSSTQLNNLFIDLQSDMRILHQEMVDINRVIDITFERNKLFYRRLKNRIAAMWKQIELFRQQSFNLEGSTYTFFESFSENSGMYLVDLDVDTKSGILALTPGYINSFNSSADVANVTMTLFPEANKDGGLFDTTNATNTFTYNFTQGDRMMLRNGLWKMQMLTAAVPEIALDVFNTGNTQSYRGIVAYVDITFASQRLINHIDIDPYGDFTTTILSLSYLPSETSVDWLNVVDNTGNLISGADNDWIVLRNFVPFSAKTLRIKFYQPNYQTVNQLLNQVDSMVDKMVQGIIENRFDKIKYNYNGPDQFPKFNSFTDGDIYDQVMDIIETGGDISTLQGQITNLLIPQPITIQADVSNWKLFNLGAWEIDPQLVGYAPQSVGIYVSHDPTDHTMGYQLAGGSPTYARLYTSQTEENTTSIEWSLLADVDGLNYVEIPIMANTDTYRIESCICGDYNALKYSTSIYRTNTNYSNKYSMIKLSFPVHPEYQSLLTIYENGVEFISNDLSYADFYNSTELYLPTSNFVAGNSYTIKYVPAVIDTVKVWTIAPNQTPIHGMIDFGSMCAFANAKAADNMINILSNFSGTPPSNVSIASSYTKVSHLCTRTEFDNWFRKGVVNTFIDAAVDHDDNMTTTISWFTGGSIHFEYHTSDTRATWLYRSNCTTPYSENNNNVYTWDAMVSAVPNIKVTRNQF